MGVPQFRHLSNGGIVGFEVFSIGTGHVMHAVNLQPKSSFLPVAPDAFSCPSRRIDRAMDMTSKTSSINAWSVTFVF